MAQTNGGDENNSPGKGSGYISPARAGRAPWGNAYHIYPRRTGSGRAPDTKPGRR